MADPAALAAFKSRGNGSGNKMNLRVEILEKLLATNEDGTSAKVNSLRQAIHRCKTDLAEGPSDSLDLLRQVFQHEMTEEIRLVIDRYLQNAFAPAIENLKRNGHPVISNEIINELCLNILDAAREPFLAKSENEAPAKRTCIPSGSLLRSRQQRNSPDDRHKQYESDDNESDTSMASFSTYRTGQGRDGGTPYDTQNRPKKRGRPRKVDVDSGRSGTPIMKGTSPVTFAETCKWNPDRITTDTKFVLGSKVNKLLNLGHRGHIFIKYPRIFRYVCDEEDKVWMNDRQISARTNGKVFFMVLDDVLELATLENAPQTLHSDLCRYAFMVPDRVALKMRKSMLAPFELLKARMAPTASPSAQVISPGLQSPLNANLTLMAFHNLLANRQNAPPDSPSTAFLQS